MNVIDLLVRDHEKVALLFRSFEETHGSDHRTRREIVEQIHDELEDHAGVEEQLFYPEVARRLEAGRDPGLDLREAQEEHRLVRNLLAELAELDPAHEGYDAKVKVLKDMVEHHVHEEEARMLPQARLLLPPERLDEMGAEVEARRAEQRTERMAVASPDAVVPPPDDGPPSDRVRSGDVMAVSSPPPSSVSPDDPIASEGPRRHSDQGGLGGRRRPPRRTRGGPR